MGYAFFVTNSKIKISPKCLAKARSFVKIKGKGHHYPQILEAKSLILNRSDFPLIDLNFIDFGPLEFTHLNPIYQV
jgi:hypothetical protein